MSTKMKISTKQLRRIIREAMQLEMFDTGSAGDEVGGTSLEQKKEQCKQVGGKWISDDPSGKGGHCSKPIDEAVSPEGNFDIEMEVRDTAVNMFKGGADREEVEISLFELFPDVYYLSTIIDDAEELIEFGLR